MNYTIQTLDAFSVIGQATELTRYQNQNIKISMDFWKQFNNNLQKAYLSQGGNWTKYAFMEKRQENLYYFCAIPKRSIVPEGFLQKDIGTCTCLVGEHIGAMNRIYDTYKTLYQEILPATGYEPLREGLLHFERYDRRFYWNQEDSVIEIWIPIKERSPS